MSSIRLDPPHLCRSPVSLCSTAISLRCVDADQAHLHTAPGKSGPDPLISVVIPAKNEANSLPSLLAELTDTLRQLDYLNPVAKATQAVTFEVIVVDDGSTDATYQTLNMLVSKYPSLRPICLTSSIGQSGCLMAGIWQARGTWIATLDADLQNHPGDLKVLWQALIGYDAALGWRVKRADPWSKRIISWIANRARNAALGQIIRDTGCAVRIFPRCVALRLPAFQGVHRFIGPLLLREGCRIVQVPVRHRPRTHGRSHYGLWNRSWNVLIDLLGVMWLMQRPIIHDLHEPGWSSSTTDIVEGARLQDALHNTNNREAGKTLQPEVATTC